MECAFVSVQGKDGKYQTTREKSNEGEENEGVVLYLRTFYDNHVLLNDIHCPSSSSHPLLRSQA